MATPSDRKKLKYIMAQRHSLGARSDTRAAAAAVALKEAQGVAIALAASRALQAAKKRSAKITFLAGSRKSACSDLVKKVSLPSQVVQESQG